MNAKVKKLISYYKPYKKDLFWDLFFSALSASIDIIIPLIIQYIINNAPQFEKHQNIESTIILGCSIFLLLIVLYFCNKHMKNQGKNIAIKIEEDMNIELFEHYQKLSFNFYDKNSTGKLLSRMMVDVRNISNVLQLIPERIFVGFTIKFIAVFTAFFIINPIFGFAAFIVFVFIFIAFLCFLRKTNRAYMECHESTSNYSGMVEESLAGMRTVQSFGNQKAQALKFRKFVGAHYKNVRSIVTASSSMFASSLTFTTGIIPLIAIISIFFTMNRGINIKEMIILMLFTSIIIQPISQTFAIVEIFQDSWAGYKRFFEILAMKPEIVNSKDAMVLKNIDGNIEFKNVSFQYQKNEKNIFKNLDLKIHAGEFVALVGSSGAGKSTLCNLIPRFYDVSNGEILLDGENIKHIKLESLRKNIGFVHQDTFLFSGTIEENIRYGKLDATESEIIEAAKNAYAHNFIMKFPDKYNTKIGPRGTKLSGGQKQRIAIAKVFLKNPPILIFDEATSNLDNESERYIQKSMQKLSKDRTTIVIAHRLSTIRNAKRILVISDGKVVEEGTHEQLLKQGGVYFDFYNLL